MLLNRIPVMRVEMDEREANAAKRAILSGWVTMGPEVEAFEREFAESAGAKFACAVSSGTAALHVALAAAGVGDGDEAITASYSFIATASAIRHCGAIPVFADIDPGTFNMLPDRVEAAITPKTKAILCVHQMGMPCDLAAFTDIAARHGLALIEDAACAVGSEVQINGRWERIGQPHGDAACFSFHPRKVLTTGDGGMITTRHETWDKRFRLLRHHGMNVPAHTRHTSDQVIWESYDEVAYNYRMTDIQGAIGRVQLQRLGGIVERRRALAAQYHRRLSGIDGVTVPREPRWARSNWQSYCVRLDSRFDQRGVMQGLLDEGIATRRGVMCAHREPAYADRPATWRAAPGGLERSEQAQDHTIVLPLYPQMPGEELDHVVETLTRILR